MVTPKKRHLSFYITEKTLQVAKLSGKGDTFTSFFETAVPPGLIGSGEVKNSEAFKQFLIAVRKQAKITDKFVNIGLPETKATTRALTLPAIEETEIEQAIIREAPTFLPFSVAEEYIDWKIIEKTPEATRVLLSAVPRRVVEGFAEAFLGAGFSPVSFETTSLTLFRMIPKVLRTLTMAAEINDSNTVLILVINGTIEVCSVISDNTNLLDKMGRVIRFFVEQKTEGKMPEILYLTGKNAPAIASQVTSALGVKTQFLKVHLPKYPEQKQIEYGVLYTLADKIVAKPSDAKTINIMPEALTLKYDETQRVRFERLLKIFFVLAILVFSVVTFISYQTVVKAKNTIQRRAVSSSSSTSTGEVSFSPAKIKLLGTIAQQNDDVLQAFDTIFKSQSQGVSIGNISCEKEKNECIVIGRASGRDQLITYKESLEKAKSFSKVTLPFSSLENDADFEYRLILSLPTKTVVKQVSPPKK